LPKTTHSPKSSRATTPTPTSPGSSLSPTQSRSPSRHPGRSGLQSAQQQHHHQRQEAILALPNLNGPPNVKRSASPLKEHHATFEEALEENRRLTKQAMTSTPDLKSAPPIPIYTRKNGAVASDSPLNSSGESYMAQNETNESVFSTLSTPGQRQPQQTPNQLSPKDLTKVFLAPQYVPPTTTGGVSSARELAAVYEKNIINGSDHPPTKYSYEAEESCLLSTSAASETHTGAGDKNDPFHWSRYDTFDGIDKANGSHVSSGNGMGREIMVVMPVMGGSDVLTGASDAAAQGKAPSKFSSRAPAAWSTDENTADLDADSYHTSGNATANSTQSERQVILQRAKAMLEAHKEYLDSPSLNMETTKHGAPTPSTQDRKNQSGKRQQSHSRVYPEEYGNDDGLAPLGGSWPPPILNGGSVTPEMLEHPEHSLHNLHAGAARYLKVSCRFVGCTWMFMKCGCQFSHFACFCAEQSFWRSAAFV
jgi:hypothetical protein